MNGPDPNGENIAEACARNRIKLLVVGGRAQVASRNESLNKENQI